MLIPKHIISHPDVWFQKTKLVMVNILSSMLQKQGFSHQWVTLQWLQPSFIYSFFQQSGCPDSPDCKVFVAYESRSVGSF